MILFLLFVFVIILIVTYLWDQGPVLKQQMKGEFDKYRAQEKEIHDAKL